MGMYTEIYVKATFNSTTPQEVIDIISYMMGDGDCPSSLPEHELFQCARWDFMLRCCSYYHIPKAVGEFFKDDIATDHYLVVRSDLKNYDNEIQKFFDWVSPYVEQNCDDKTFLGYSLYEECNIPDFYYVLDGKIVK